MTNWNFIALKPSWWDPNYRDLRSLRVQGHSGHPCFELLEVDEDEVEFDVFNDLGFLSEDALRNHDPVDWHMVRAETSSRILGWVREFFPTVTVCPFCRTPLEMAEHGGKKEVFEDDVQDVDDVWMNSSINLLSCPFCGYWQAKIRDVLPESYSRGGGTAAGKFLDLYLISKLREFEPEFPEGLDHELAQHIRRNPDLLHNLHPTRFEKLLCSCFRANYSDCEAIHVGKPDDGGVDVFFVDAGRVQWLVQAKCRQAPTVSEGVSTVRNLLGSLVLEGETCGIVASTADHFTYRALEAADRARLVGFTIRLLDKGILARMLTSLIPPRPWLEVIKVIMPEASDVLCQRISPTSQLFFDFLRNEEHPDLRRMRDSSEQRPPGDGSTRA